MKLLNRDDSFELWDKYWNQMKKEWFKVEVLQDYSAEDSGPSLDAWKKGDKSRSIELIKTENHTDWINDCQKKIAEDVKLTRVHIVKKPLSTYMEWELEHYKYVNVPQCGEKIFLIDYYAVADLDIPSGDIMFFDDKVVINTYNEDGFMTQAAFYDETDDVKKFLLLREELRKLMKPME
jgi:hypothetical protein